jgi:hypothetical protein
MLASINDHNGPPPTSSRRGAASASPERITHHTAFKNPSTSAAQRAVAVTVT